ncbi:MAG: tyrosine-type recombinase/integrase [Candidatus Eisenbacteria bacterium]
MTKQLSFSSALGSAISDYLALKKSLGRRFAVETRVLAHLDRFLVEMAHEDATLSPDSFETWSLTLGHLMPTVRRNRMRIVRNLCLYLRRTHPDCFIPDMAGFPASHPPRRPYIFTKGQIVRLLQATSALSSSSTSPLYPEVYRIAIVLLYTAGLRRGELIRLVDSDYDPVEHTLLIQASKFHKSRLVALSVDAAAEMDSYLQARRRLPHGPNAPLLVSRSGGLGPYTGAGLGMGLRRLFCRAGIRTAEGHPPRVHDFRHTYAVHALLGWYHAGIDVQAKLPVLSTAMGHVSIASTAYYLAYLDPVAQAASDLFAQHCQPILTATSTERDHR